MVNFALQAPAWLPRTARGNQDADAASAEARLSPRIAAASIVNFWIFYFVINTVRMAVMDAPDQLHMLLRRFAVSITGMVITALLCLLLRRFDGKLMRVQVTIAFLASIPASIAYAMTNYAAFYVVHPGDSELKELQDAPAQHMTFTNVILDQAFSWYFFIVAWAVLYIALSYAAKVRAAERAAARFQAEAQTAQLRALRYQINPHFLFNTLNSLSTLVMRQSGDEAERMIINLSNFFRTSLTADPTEDVSLADEVKMQRLYLDIEQIRFPDRLKVALDIPTELECAAVPGMILQPIVENAIKYGVARSGRPVTITICARTVDGLLNLTVEDDGTADVVRGAAEDRAPGHGVGLRNVCERLAARFGAQADCRYGARPQGGFRVALTMPLKNSLSAT
jgi:two-component system, LytTR family, sensor kinase